MYLLHKYYYYYYYYYNYYYCQNSNKYLLVIYGLKVSEQEHSEPPRILLIILPIYNICTIVIALLLYIGTYNVHLKLSETKRDYVQGLLDNHDIVMFQEHWLYASQTHVIQNVFPDISLHCV